MVCTRYRPEMDFVHPIEAVIPGAQGRVLAVLVETTAELNLRTLARLAGVSVSFLIASYTFVRIFAQSR